MKTVIVFNGKPRSGKDTIAEMLSSFIENNCGMSSPLFNNKDILMDQAARLLDMSYEEWCAIYNFGKDITTVNNSNITPRQFVCKLAEEFIKPIFGKHFYGLEVARKISLKFEDDDCDICIVTDGGFESEIQSLLKYDIIDRIVIIRLERDDIPNIEDTREDLSVLEYDNDNIIKLIIDNNTSKEDCLNRIIDSLAEYDILPKRSPIQTAINTLSYFQNWRKGIVSEFDMSPRELSEQIDVILNHFNVH